MKIAYLDCLSGISGDMTLGALVDAGVELAALQAGIDSLGLPQPVRFLAHTVKKKGFRATQIEIQHEPEHAHRHLHHIEAMIDSSQLTPRQQLLAKQIFQKLGAAEAKVHGTTIQKVHFHEVGAIDSIADIVGSAIGWDLLGVDRIVCSPVPTGNGTVTIAHGRCSIPAPATAELMREASIPIAPCEIQAELTTPTGAAIVATLASEFGPLPAMTIGRIGYGAGQRDLDSQANVLRLLVGETSSATTNDQIWILETNLDDISPELIGHTCEKLRTAGSLDCFTTSIQMKKSRPGITLTVLCTREKLDSLEAIIFRETTALGVRRWPASRRILTRRAHTVSTEYGDVAGVLAELPTGEMTFAPEYESCKLIAEQADQPLRNVYDAARQAFNSAGQ